MNRFTVFGLAEFRITKHLCSYFRILSLCFTRSYQLYSPTQKWVFPVLGLDIPCRCPCVAGDSPDSCLHPQDTSLLSWPSLQEHFIDFVGWCIPKSIVITTTPPSLEWIDYVSIQIIPPAIPTWCSHLKTDHIAHQRQWQGRGGCLSSPSQHVQQFCCGSWPAVQNPPGGKTLSIIVNIKGKKCENKRHLWEMTMVKVLFDQDMHLLPLNLVGVLWQMVLPVQKCLSAYLS